MGGGYHIYIYMGVDLNFFIPECLSARKKINFNKTNAELSRRHIYIRLQAKTQSYKLQGSR